jgi:[ribosomal protein S5]-alanine N-acetyltransferase
MGCAGVSGAILVVVLETERLVLREVGEDDAGFVLELLNSPGFIENIADRGVRTEDAARAYIRERIAASYAEHGFGMWAVVPKGEAAPVGLAGLVKRDVLPHVDVGYAFLEPAWGKGYAQESAAAVLRHARQVLGLSTIVAITTPDNRASQRVLEKIGLRYVDLIELPGWDEPSAYFST